jgi:hypothetical protein
VSHELNPDVVRTIREMGRPTTPDELRQRGVRRLRSVGVNEVSLLIERAVNRTLLRRTIGAFTEEDLLALKSEAQSDFAQQLAGLRAMADSRHLVEEHREKVQHDLDVLRRELAVRHGAVEQESGARRQSSQNRMRALETELRERLALHGSFPAQSPALEQLVSDVARLCARFTGEELAEQRRESAAEIELLRRRIAKLMESLETTEKVLAALAKLKDVEFGIASIYRTVQGLSPEESDRNRKLDLLQSIFRSNVDLRDQLTANGALA